MDSDAEKLLEHLDNGDYDGAREYAERHAFESDVCAEYVTKNKEEIEEFHRAGSDLREHEAGNPDFW